MLILRVFPPAMGLKSPSPFSMKAIALLQMSGLDYKIEPGDPRKAPKKKLPVLVDGTKEIPDSTHIQAYLKHTHSFDPDAGLSREQVAIGRAFQHMLEDHLYWVGVYVRWIENPDYTKQEFFGAIPKLMRNFIFNMVHKQVRQSLYGQGMGRHTPAQVHAFGAADIKAVADYLGDKDYFFGDTPTSIDATLFASLINNLVPKITMSEQNSVKSYPTLMVYCDRFIERFDMP